MLLRIFYTWSDSGSDRNYISGEWMWILPTTFQCIILRIHVHTYYARPRRCRTPGPPQRRSSYVPLRLRVTQSHEPQRQRRAAAGAAPAAPRATHKEKWARHPGDVTCTTENQFDNAFISSSKHPCHFFQRQDHLGTSAVSIQNQFFAAINFSAFAAIARAAAGSNALMNEFGC
jgi:hypothetical protein